MKQNEIARGSMFLWASFFLIIGLVGVASLPVLIVFTPVSALGPLLFFGLLSMSAGVWSFFQGYNILKNLLGPKTGEYSLAGSEAVGSNLSPAGAGGLSAQVDKPTSFTRVQPEGDHTVAVTKAASPDEPASQAAATLGM